MSSDAAFSLRVFLRIKHLLPCTVPANTVLIFDVMKISVYLLYCLRKSSTVKFICKFFVLENVKLYYESRCIFLFCFLH